MNTTKEILHSDRLVLREIAIIRTHYSEIEIFCLISIKTIKAISEPLKTEKIYTYHSYVALILDEATEEASIRSQFSVLTYADCFTKSIRFRERLASMSIAAQNFDNTLFSTKSNGTHNNQTIYYPPESDQIFGACDCLRFRNTRRPCEHLALIGRTVLFSATPEPAAIEP